MKITRHGKKSIVVIISTYFFVIVFLIVSLAFSTSSFSLAVNGALLVRSSEDVRITNVQLNKTVLNSASQTVTPSYTVHTVEGGVRLTTGFSQIVYDVTVTNLSSQNVLVTNVAAEKWSNDNLQYALENLVINETVIPAASGGGGDGNKSSKASGGGGGGSSFVASSVIYKYLPENVIAKLTTTNPSTTGGSITITYLGASY